VHHTAHGDGWVWGSGLGRVTVRFETRETPPGPVLTFAADNPDLTIRPLGAPPAATMDARSGGTITSPHD